MGVDNSFIIMAFTTPKVGVMITFAKPPKRRLLAMPFTLEIK